MNYTQNINSLQFYHLFLLYLIPILSFNSFNAQNIDDVKKQLENNNISNSQIREIGKVQGYSEKQIDGALRSKANNKDEFIKNK